MSVAEQVERTIIPVRVVALVLFGGLLLGGLAGCSTYGSLFEPADSAPAIPVNPATIRDAVPRAVNVTSAGNKSPYTVDGKTYRVLPSDKGYSAVGIASWYGTKFHGRRTADGERYNLYGMTAAHRTLPIPTYVRVTNLENGRQAIVRVNDRGPFHDNRLIDLSYAAAVKLGYANKGTARVRVDVIDPSAKPAKPQVAEQKVAETKAAAKDSYFLQVGAFRSLELANRLRARLASTTNQTVKVSPTESGGFYRVQVGPLDQSKLRALSDLLIEEGHAPPQWVRN